MKKIPEDHIKLVGRVRMGERGQIVIPAETREKLNLSSGDYLLALAVPNSNAIAFMPETELQSIINQSSGELTNSLRIISHDELS